MDGPLNQESAKQLRERAKDGVTFEEVRHDLLLLLDIFRELRVHRSDLMGWTLMLVDIFQYTRTEE